MPRFLHRYRLAIAGLIARRVLNKLVSVYTRLRPQLLGQRRVRLGDFRLPGKIKSFLI